MRHFTSEVPREAMEDNEVALHNMSYNELQIQINEMQQTIEYWQQRRDQLIAIQEEITGHYGFEDEDAELESLISAVDIESLGDADVPDEYMEEEFWAAVREMVFAAVPARDQDVYIWVGQEWM